MGPSISGSIKAGFRVANRSWAGMGFLAGGWIAVFVAALILFFIGIRVVGVPDEVLRQAVSGAPAGTVARNMIQGRANQRADERQRLLKNYPEAKPATQPAASATATGTPTEPAAATAPAAPAENAQQPAAPTPEAAATAPAPAAPEAGTPPAAAPAAPAVTLPPAPEPPAPAAVSPDQEFVMRAWPALVLPALLLIAASIWLYGGQIGYVLKLVRGQAAAVADFWATGNRAFVPLLMTWLLALGAVAVLVLASALIGLIVSALPKVLAGILAALLTLALLTGLVWLLVRVVFWYVAIVADGAGPIAGLKRSFQITTGRWWKTSGLLGLALVIFMAASLLFAIPSWLGDLIGGVAGGIILFIGNVLELVVVNLYLGFALSGALVKFYEDSKSSVRA